MEKENVDNLFRDTLDDFAQSPDPKVWDRIQASLDKKAQRKRRVIPLWWQVGGVAAAMALILFLLLPGNESDSLVPAIEEVTTTPSQATPANEDSEDLNSTKETQGEVTKVNSVRTAVGTKTSSPSRTTIEVAVTEAATTAKEKSPSTNAGEAEVFNPIPNADPAVAQIDSETDKGSDFTFDVPVATKALNTEEETLGIATNETPAVAETQKEDATKEFRDLFEEVSDEEIPQSKDSDGKWAVGPSVAPVYYTASGTGSPIDNAFVNNDKAGNINMSYGVKITYELSDKWQLRSGLHKVDYTYDTNDIVFSSSLSTTANASIRNIDFASTSNYLVVESSTLPVTKAGATGSDEIAAKNPARSGTMIQEMGYLEIPVEINYVLLDKKVGVNVVSGLSSLFLLDNVVNLESENGTTEMGTANNINSLNFSANFGLGIDYDISKKVKLQLEPLIKYQLNTFSNTAGQFRPYSLGIYSGIQYKF
ncbi:MAG: PorT family protein [Bacteroidia bacterium]|nr:PorT family protein [Bacteroidia bacterium]